jgi:hypothetical protein
MAKTKDKPEARAMTGAQGARRKNPQGQRSMGALRRAAVAAGQACVAGLEDDASPASPLKGLAALFRGRRAQAGFCAALAAAALAAAAAAALA